VEEVVVRHAPVLYLHVGDRWAGTTGEHPCFVRGKGWLPANQIIAGDHLAGHDGRWVVVGAVERTEEFQTVFNLRIADFRTYFVGALEWGFTPPECDTPRTRALAQSVNWRVELPRARNVCDRVNSARHRSRRQPLTK
jgi:hypothetical protein